MVAIISSPTILPTKNIILTLLTSACLLAINLMNTDPRTKVCRSWLQSTSRELYLSMHSSLFQRSARTLSILSWSLGPPATLMWATSIPCRSSDFLEKERCSIIYIQGGPKKSLWCDLEEKCLWNSKIFFDRVFLSIYRIFSKSYSFLRVIEKKL